MTGTGQVLLAALGLIGAAILAFLGWIARRVVLHESALALLVQEVNPPGDKPSLRELLAAQSTAIAVLSSQQHQWQRRAETT